MNEKKVILNYLLDKYERSAGFLGDRAQYRRILLKCDRKGFPEYEYTNVQIRDAFNSAVLSMSTEQIVFYQWVNGREEKVLQEIWLNAECLEQAYATAGRSSLSERIRDLDIMLKTTADQCLTAWIKTGLLAIDAEMCSRRKLFGFLNAGENLIHGVLDALSAVDKLNGSSITIRSFSIACYQDSKYFENEIKDHVISFAKQYEPIIHEYLSSDESITDKEILDYLGIISRSEIFELCGKFILNINGVRCDFGGFYRGVCINSQAEKDIEFFDFSGINSILFIENKTNYEEYVASHIDRSEVVIYHGGFYSPAKGDFFHKISNSAPKGTGFRFWADIDMGGFQMFRRLQIIIPDLHPFKMGPDEFKQYMAQGYRRDHTYLEKLRQLKRNPTFSQFEAVIDLILEYGITIEQEVML